MTYRVSRHNRTSTFTVNGQLCKIFLEPIREYRPGFWIWNVGFAVGKSRRQLNDWYWRRNNKRRRSLENKLVGKSGIKAIAKGFQEVLKLRWFVEPGDVIQLDCTSGDPDRQFYAWSRWHKYHPEWAINRDERKFFWYRPPYPEDPIREQYWIRPVLPENLLANTSGQNYYSSFRILPKSPCTALSMKQTLDLLSQALHNQ